MNLQACFAVISVIVRAEQKPHRVVCLLSSAFLVCLVYDISGSRIVEQYFSPGPFGGYHIHRAFAL